MSDRPSDQLPPRPDEPASPPVPTSQGLVLPEQILPPNLFVLPSVGPIIYPTMMAPLVVKEPRHVATVEEAISRNRIIGILQVRGEGELRDHVEPRELYEVGVVVKILKRIRMPDGSLNLLVQSMKRFRSKRVLSDHPYLVVESEYLEDIIEKSTEMDALSRSVISHVKKLSEVNPFFTDEMRLAMINAPGPGTVADLVAFALSLPRQEAQNFLETVTVKTRYEKLLGHLRREQEVADVQKRIADEVDGKLTKMQREFFLKEQLKSIRRELGIEEDGREKSIRTFRERIEATGMPSDARKVALEELSRFETLNETSPEYNVSRNWLETVCSLPWSQETEDRLDLEAARDLLDEEHFGLEKVKERITEFLAVRKLKADPRGSIICLVGPPGVGKTSIGKSIARTMGRNFFRFSLGGMRDEAEIKGHRRTYVGALPGKVINGIKRAGSRNAVLMLDEIDKLGASFQGDPASALLEVLDSEQNHAFLDHYLDIPFDLSKVLFIATANSTATIPAPLLDRMEIIELPGYTLEEKEDIAVRHVLPKVLRENGLDPRQVRIEKSALRRMMTDYAREPGLRTLQQLIGRIARKAAARVVSMGRKPAKMPVITISEGSLAQWLGPQRFYNEAAERITVPGVVTGLAWTSMGGEILFVEAQDHPGSGNLKVTGQLGEVMTESAGIAWSYVRRKVGRELKLEADFFKSRDFHLHVPAGGIPKDGPSAGITMAAAIYSLLSGRVFRNKFAMTGELSLVGKVLPVGGIKEKILAAKRAGISSVILPRQNQKDIADIPEYALKGMTLHFVSNVEDVFELVLGDPTTPRRRKPVSTVIRTATRRKPRPRSKARGTARSTKGAQRV